MSGRDMFAQYVTGVIDQVVGGEVGFVHIVVGFVTRGFLFDQELDESHDVTDVGHGFAILSLADHHKLTGSNLMQEVVDVSSVLFTEDNGGAEDVDVPVAMCFAPLLQHLFGLPFADAVMVERIDRSLLDRKSTRLNSSHQI